jgi:hypothetical protein
MQALIAGWADAAQGERYKSVTEPTGGNSGCCI